MSSTFDTGTGGTPGRDARDALDRETQSARNELGSAGAKLREGAQSALSEAKDRASATAEDGKSAAASSLEDFAAAIRRASDELGDRDQSLGAGLVRQVAGGLEQASDALKGRSIPEIAGSVADFARRQPTAFLIGATLAGVALGRFARASGDHGRSHDHGRSQGGSYRGAGDRFADRGRDTQGNAYTGRSNAGASFEERDRRAGTAAEAGATSSGTTAFSSTSGSAGYTPGNSVTGGAEQTGASDSQLNRYGASGSTDTNRLPGHEENAR